MLSLPPCQESGPTAKATIPPFRLSNSPEKQYKRRSDDSSFTRVSGSAGVEDGVIKKLCLTTDRVKVIGERLRQIEATKNAEENTTFRTMGSMAKHER